MGSVTAAPANLRAPRLQLQWLYLVIAVLTALMLFALQQFYYEIQDSKDEAREDAASVLALLQPGQASRRPGEFEAALALAARGFDRLTVLTWCRQGRCVTLQPLPDAPACASDNEWRFASLCMQVSAPDDPDTTLRVRYSLTRAHDATLRDLAFLAGILSVAAAAAWVGTRHLRGRVAQAEDELRLAASVDTLTQLPNRAEFEAQAERFIRAVHAGEKRGVMLLLDLDGFKEINDQFGHHVGDRMLGVVTQRISATLGPGDLASRLGGDEFGLLITCRDGLARVDRKAAELIAQISSPAMVDGHSLTIGVSIGAIVLDAKVANFDEALMRSDLALFEVKRSARGRMLYFADEMETLARSRYQIQDELVRAIAENQLFLEYQPQVDVHGDLRGVEALVRWRHPARGLVRPDQFIGIAEDSGLIVALGMKVVEIACIDLMRARDQGVHLPYVSINVSPRQLSEPQLVAALMSALDRHFLSPRDLELEVTESSLMDANNADATIKQLSQLGFRIAIDDFGTGYSSLSRLHSMPVSKLKIDRAFVRQLVEGENGGTIAESILSLAKKLRLKTVAEGVETEDQAQWLRGTGCELMQGYLFARPMPFGQLLEWAEERLLATGAGKPSWANTAPLDM